MNQKGNNLAADDACPYCDDNADVCKASVTSLRLGALLRSNRCNSEAYDNWSLFLARCLRSVRYRYAS
jgi:hypothetical protein